MDATTHSLTRYCQWHSPHNKYSCSTVVTLIKIKAERPYHAESGIRSPSIYAYSVLVRVYINILLVRVYINIVLVRVYINILLVRVYINIVLVRVYINILLVRVYINIVLVRAYINILLVRVYINILTYIIGHRSFSFTWHATIRRSEAVCTPDRCTLVDMRTINSED